jgi:two-component sensor histidine kinase
MFKNQNLYYTGIKRQKSVAITRLNSRLTVNHKFLIALLLLVFNALTLTAQNINREMVNSLLVQLRQSKPDTGRIKILLELGKFHLYKQGELKSDLDSSFYYLRQARELSESFHAWKWIHETEGILVILSMERGDKAIAHSQYLQLLNDCKITNDKKGEANARFRYGIWLMNINAPDAADDLTKAAEIYKGLKNQQEEIHALYEVAFIHFNQGKTSQAEEELLNVVDRFRAIHDPNIHYTYNLLSTVYRLKGDFNKGLKYAILAVETMTNVRDTLKAAYFYGDLARMYMEVGDHESEIEWYEKAVAKWRQQNLAEFGMYLAQGYIIKDMISRGKSHEALNTVLSLKNDIPPATMIQRACIDENLAYCYDALQDYPLAEKYYLEAVQLYQASKMNFEVSQESYQAAGRFYLNRKEFTKAGNYLKQALAFTPQKLSLAAVKDIHFMLFKIDSAQSNYLSAIDHYRQHKALNDSIFNRTRIREIEELQIRFETVKKEHDFQLLNDQNKLQDIKLQQASQTQKFTFGGIVLLLLICGLLLNQYRIKQQSNKLLQSSQIEINNKNHTLENLVIEKEWLVKEIHHRVKNNLQIVISLLNTQSAYLENEDALDAIRNSQHRMQTMSLIHQKLYQSENLSTIDMSVYIRELVEYLSDSFSRNKNIIMDIKVSPVKLDVSQAVPLGLILNEAISNSIKYAFKETKKGRIDILLEPVEGDRYLLCVADNGPGLPEAFDPYNTGSLGMSLMLGLTQQLDGDFLLENKNGLRVCITFKAMEFNNLENDIS